MAGRRVRHALPRRERLEADRGVTTLAGRRAAAREHEPPARAGAVHREHVRAFELADPRDARQRAREVAQVLPRVQRTRVASGHPRRETAAT